MPHILSQFPPVSRIWLISCILITTLCSLDFISPYSLFLSWKLIFPPHYQLWRLFTSYCFFSHSFNINFIFQLYFLIHYCKSLEETSFRGRSSDFLYFLLFGIIIQSIIGPLFHINFLGGSLTFMIVYLWSRRNPLARLNFLGIFVFSAPYLPWVLLIFSYLLRHDIMTDLLGLICGHLYYYFEDIYPLMNSNGGRILKTPKLFKWLFGELNYQQHRVNGAAGVGAAGGGNNNIQQQRRGNNQNNGINPNNEGQIPPQDPDEFDYVFAERENE